MRSLFLSAALASTLAVACNTDPADTTLEATSAALTAGDAEADSAALGTLAFIPGSALTAGERVAHLKAWVASSLTCADATTTGDGVALTFSSDCSWNGRKWTGTVAITWDAVGKTAAIEMEGVKVNGATLSGTIDVASLGDRHVTVDADMTKTRADGKVVDGTWDAEYQWDDTSYTVVASQQTLNVNGHSATRSVDQLVWAKADHAPSSGTVTLNGFRGRSWTFVYAVVDGAHQVTVTGPRGTKTFVIGDDGAVE